MKIVLTHAYSSTNSGDGLLVAEAADLVREAFPAAQVDVLALDPESFGSDDFRRVCHPITGGTESPTGRQVVLSWLENGLRGRRLGEGPTEMLGEADIVVGVGGGYLRGKNFIESLKMRMVHVPQLPSVGGPPSFYLPQSIGPLKFGLGGVTSTRLSSATEVFVRDDRSKRDLAEAVGPKRYPDMALLGLPGVWDATIARGLSGGTSRSGMVARQLVGGPRGRLYEARIKGLVDTLNLEFLVQASSRGNNDPAFYESLGYPGRHRPMKEAVSAVDTSRPATIVSVRLHGAIESIRSGVPSVHLSYERKGFGAFSDLGLDDFVHNVFDFDPAAVARQVAQLTRDPSEYWDRVSASIPRLVSARQELVVRIRQAG